MYSFGCIPYFRWRATPACRTRYRLVSTTNRNATDGAKIRDTPICSGDFLYLQTQSFNYVHIHTIVRPGYHELKSHYI